MLEFLKTWLQERRFDFMRWRVIAAVCSFLAVAVAWTSFFTVQPNWGIDFTGGTEIHLRFEDQVEIGEIRAALRELELGDDAVQQVGARDGGEFTVRIADPTFGADELEQDVVTRLQGEYGDAWLNPEATRFDAEVGARMIVGYHGDLVDPRDITPLFADVRGVSVQHGIEDNQLVIQFPGMSRQIESRLQEVLPERAFEVMSVEAVGPRVGGELRRQGILAVGITLALVLVYVAFRFDVTYAPGAILALFHDISLVLGIFVLMGLELNLAMIGALLTIVGYSLNDTIVIFDRIRENRDRYRRQEVKELVNTSVNETLVRTLATSGTSLLAMSAFLFLGGAVIQDFALAMALGIIFGTYSTLFIASPTILVMERLRPYLGRLVVTPPEEDEEEEEDPEEGEGPVLSEAEQRRRQRERAEREQWSGSL